MVIQVACIYSHKMDLQGSNLVSRFATVRFLILPGRYSSCEKQIRSASLKASWIVKSLQLPGGVVNLSEEVRLQLQLQPARQQLRISQTLTMIPPKLPLYSYSLCSLRSFLLGSVEDRSIAVHGDNVDTLCEIQDGILVSIL